MDWRAALGVPQTVEENVVYYAVYPTSEGTDLEGLRRACTEHALSCTCDYVWQRDGFELQCSNSTEPPWVRAGKREGSALSTPPCLWGATRFGDSVEDEWLIVFLLKLISARIPDIAIQTWDDDGQFLLIEAAFAIPRWLKPDNSGNRVWLRGGRLHIVRSPGGTGARSRPLALQEALVAMSSGQGTEARAGVQAALEARLEGYPARAQQNLHWARCLIPARVARVVGMYPQLVSDAVRAFVHRSKSDMKAVSRMSHFPPQDVVPRLVHFHRSLFAQLVQHQFQAPKGYPMPAYDAPSFKCAELGMKLTAGLEILYQKSSEHLAACAGVHNEKVLDAKELESNPSWLAFKSSLEKNGYYRGNIEGSREHRELTAAAVNNYLQSTIVRNEAAALSAPARLMDAALQDPETRGEPCCWQPAAEDDDSWLYSGHQDIEEELQRRAEEMGRGNGLGDGTGECVEFDPGDLADSFRAFVDHFSTHEGAEVPQDQFGAIQFDPDKFVGELETALGLAKVAPNGSSSEEDCTSSAADSEEGGSADVSDHVKGFAGAGGHPGGESCRGESGRSDEVLTRDLVGTSSRSGIGGGTCGDLCQVDGDVTSVNARWEARTATDSDDDSTVAGGFMESYGEALEVELSATKMAESFERIQLDGAQPQTSASRDGASGAGADEESRQVKGQPGETAGGELPAVDLDMNLVKSLLKSYVGQHGVAGPAGNAAAMMAMRLPDHVDGL